MKRLILAALLLSPGLAWGQVCTVTIAGDGAATVIEVPGPTGATGATGATGPQGPSGLNVESGTDDPGATCTVGDFYLETDQQDLYFCYATDSWALVVTNSSATDDEVLVGNGTTFQLQTLPEGIVSYAQATNTFSTGVTMADPGGDGIMVRTAENVTAARSITSPAGTLAITNADGVAGNIGLDVDTSIFGQFSSGTATVSGNCTLGDTYLETDTNLWSMCTSTNTWRTAISLSETSTSGMGFVIDEDSFATDSATKVPTQQSVKAYVDAEVAGASGGDTLVVKSAIESITSDATLTADNTLVVAIAASTKYMFTFEVFYSSHSDADFQYEVTCPASPTYSSGNRNAFTATSAPAAGFLNCASGALTLTHTSGTAGGIRLILYVSNGVNAGNVSFTWAQNTSNGGTTSVLEGSHVKYRVIP